MYVLSSTRWSVFCGISSALSAMTLNLVLSSVVSRVASSLTRWISLSARFLARRANSLLTRTSETSNMPLRMPLGLSNEISSDRALNSLIFSMYSTNVCSAPRKSVTSLSADRSIRGMYFSL